METYHYISQKSKLETFENDGEDLQSLTGKKGLNKMESQDNIFLSSSKEDGLARKNITAIKRRQFRRMVRETIINFSDLWRELMEDTPDCSKTRSNIINFYDWMLKTDAFWDKYQAYFKDSPQALFDYGIYQIAVKNMETVGQTSIQQAKKMMIDTHKQIFDAKHIKFGMNLTKCSTPTAYLQLIKNELIIQDCNMAFSQILMISKTKLKNSNFLELIPDGLHLHYHKIFKSTNLSDKLSDTAIFLKERSVNLYQFNLTIKSIKYNEEKKYFVIQLSKSKHVQTFGLAVYVANVGIKSHNDVFQAYCIEEKHTSRPTSSKTLSENQGKSLV